MTDADLHPLARDYLLHLQRAGHHLPGERLRELCEEITAHLRETIPLDASPEAAVGALERLGPPGDVIAAEHVAPPPPSEPRSWREWTAIILLPLGGFAFGIGWLIGLILLWSSHAWNTRDKLIGTLVAPDGIAGVWLLLLGISGTLSRSCSGQAARIDPHTGKVIQRATMHCHTTGAPTTAGMIWRIALIAFFVLGPIASAVYLAHRAAPATDDAPAPLTALMD